MLLKDRQKSILEAAILEYVKTARPVASKELTAKYKLGLSPATIRNELFDLDELGYLEQPHTSAGRVPTDMGYRFFVDYLLPRYELSDEEDSVLQDLFEETLKAEDFAREFSRRLAGLAGTFSAISMREENFFFESGLSEIIGEPEFHESEATRTFVKFTENLDEEMEELLAGFNPPIQEKIFIGRENPLRQAEGYTMILSSWKHPKGFEGFLTLIAPKRTNYARHLAILNSIRHAGE